MSVDRDALKSQFRKICRTEPVWGASAPGRVNLIGEHIDYNGGSVLPAAIDRDITMLAAPSEDRSFSLSSLVYQQPFGWDLDSPPGGSVEEGWPNYFLAVLDQFNKRGMYPTPMRVVIDGDIPTGSGLSSSAAFEVCAATLLLSSMNETMSGTETALLAQAAEHSSWVGVQCGIMDQFISVNGTPGHALEIDCATLEFKAVSLDPAKASILVVHSTVERGLVSSAYNERRSQCEEGLRRLNKISGRERSFLAKFTPSEFEEWGGELPEPVLRRARHVITEQSRVASCVRHLEGGDFEASGKLLNASHESLRDDYEVSCPELDALHEIASEIDDVYGCRMTGAGFGGCVVALVKPETSDEVSARIVSEFEKRTGKSTWTVVTPACGGAAAFS
jgi:galactokinase